MGCGFNTIGVCNTVLANLNLVVTADKARVEGEAKFLRGMTYFDLARTFGRAWNDGNGSPTTNPAVPLVLTPTTTVSGIQLLRYTFACLILLLLVLILTYCRVSCW